MNQPPPLTTKYPWLHFIAATVKAFYAKTISRISSENDFHSAAKTKDPESIVHYDRADGPPFKNHGVDNGRYKTIFDLAPVALIEVDISLLNELFTLLHQDGVIDFMAYFKNQQSKLEDLLALVTIVNVNEMTLSLFEADTRDALTSNLEKIFTAHSSQAFITQVAAIFQGTTSSRTESSVKSLKGKKRHVDLTFNVVEAGSSHGDLVLVALNDITQQKEAEIALRRGEERYKNIVKNAITCIHEIDTAGHIISMNPAGLAMLGLSDDSEIVGVNYLDLIAKKDRIRIKELLDEVVESNETQNFEFQAADGRTHFSSNFIPIAENGKVNKVVGISNDITQLIETRNALREHKDFLQNAFNSALDGITAITIKGEIKEVNPAFCAMTGFEESELIGQGIPHPCFPEEELPQILDAMMQTYRGRGSGHQLIFKTKDGHRFPVIVNASPILDHSGDVQGFIATVKDISELKLRELELVNSEKRFRTIFEHAAVGVALGETMTGKYIMINQKYCDITGYTKEELEQISFLEISHPEDLQRDLELMKELVAGRLTSFTMEKRFIKKNGDIVWAKLTVSPMWNPGEKPTQHIAVIEDITDIKNLANYRKFNAEMLERTAEEHPLPQMIDAAVHGLDRLIPGAVSMLSINRKNGKTITGYSSKMPESRIESILEICPLILSRTSEGTEGRLGHQVVENIMDDKVHHSMRKKALRIGLRAWWSQPIYSYDNEEMIGSFRLIFDRPRRPSASEENIMKEISKMLSIIIDKSDSKAELIRHRDHLEELVQKRTRELKESNRELESFSYSVSHDLRAPLTRIDGFGKALQDRCGDALDEKGKHYLNRIRGSSQDMTTLIDDLLMLSKVSLKELQKQEIDLSCLCEDIVKDLRKAHPDRAVNVAIGPGMVASVDQGLARLMLENLIANAWKFTKKVENASITIGTEKKGDLKHWFFIEDNGIGFDMRYADQMFKPFQRFCSKSEFEGSGIGLATVKRVIQKHGGQMVAEGTPGVGAKFYFKF